MAPEADDEPLTTLPLGEAVDTSAPPWRDATRPPRVPPSVAAVLAAALSRADAFLTHLYRCLQTRAGADLVLLFLCYACRLSGSVLETLSRPLLRHSARRLVAMAFKPPPATTVLLAATPPQPPLAAFALRLGGRFKAMAALISETRTMGRLWGLLGLYFAAKRLVLKSCAASAGESEKTPAVAYAQVASLIAYQAAENAAYLGSKKVLPLSTAAQGRLSLLSVRAWGLYVGMELGRLLVERSRRAGSEAEEADWSKSFARNLSWAPLMVHWGMRDWPLPDLMVSLLAAYPATGSMMDLWRETA